MLINYGDEGYGENFRPTPSRQMTEVQRLTLMKNQTIKTIMELEEKLEKEKAKLKKVEKDLYAFGNRELEKRYSHRPKPISKKEAIIEYFNVGMPESSIAEATGTSPSYIYKVLSIYRQEKGIKPNEKSMKTQQRILSLLNTGLKDKEVALQVGVSSQYVNQIKKKFENDRRD